MTFTEMAKTMNDFGFYFVKQSLPDTDILKIGEYETDNVFDIPGSLVKDIDVETFVKYYLNPAHKQ